MSLRSSCFPTHLGIYGPFNADAIRLDGGTVSFKDKEEFHLGHALVQALADRGTGSMGKWEVTVLDADWNWEGDVSLVYHNRFEWLISFENAFDLALDFAEGLFTDDQGQRRAETARSYAALADANELSKDESAIEELTSRIAVAVLNLFEKSDLVIEDDKPLSEVWKEVGEEDDTLSGIVRGWLTEHEVSKHIWIDYFIDEGLDQSVGQARQRRGQLLSNGGMEECVGWKLELETE